MSNFNNNNNSSQDGDNDDEPEEDYHYYINHGEEEYDEEDKESDQEEKDNYSTSTTVYGLIERYENNTNNVNDIISELMTVNNLENEIIIRRNLSFQRRTPSPVINNSVSYNSLDNFFNDLINEYNNEFNFNEFYNSINYSEISDVLYNILEDSALDLIMNHSFDTQPSLERKNINIDMSFKLYKDIERENKDLSCCICLDEFDENSKITVLENCDHILHFDCIKEWAKYKTSCPHCRVDLFK